MGRIDSARVLLGGLVAGLVINVVMAVTWAGLLANWHARTMERLGMDEPLGAQIAWFWVFGFVIGIALLWTYAAMRPRFGAGPRTAALAAIVAWLFMSVVPGLFDLVMEMFPFDVIAVGWLVWLVALIFGGLVGGWLYKEREPAAPQPPPGP